MKDAIVNLLKVKSLMTLILTLVFCAAVLIQMFTSVEIPQPLVTVYIAVVSFYFGTQTAKKPNEDTIVYVPNYNEAEQEFAPEEAAPEERMYE